MAREATRMLGAHAIIAPPLLLASLDVIVLLGALAALWSIERRLPRGRAMLSMVGMVCLLAAARIVFAAAPNIQPVTVAMLLIGVHLGARRGFAVGVGTAYASNLVLGFGLFAPFQALGWGLCAVAAHHLRGWLSDESGVRIARLAAAGFVAGFGFDLFVSMYAFIGIGSLTAFATYLLLGLPYDLLHATGNVVIAAWAGAWFSTLLQQRVLPELAIDSSGSADAVTGTDDGGAPRIVDGADSVAA